jgi:hypothetical protein
MSKRKASIWAGKEGRGKSWGSGAELGVLEVTAVDAKKKTVTLRTKAKPRKRPRVILAFDPGEAAGVALIVDGELWGWGAANGSTWRSLLMVARPLTEHFANIPVDEKVCVIEEGWVDRLRSGKSSLTLARRRGLAQAVGEACGFERFELVPSSTWQNGLHGSIHGKDTKELALTFARERWGVCAPTHDCAEAICLATWYLGVDV